MADHVEPSTTSSSPIDYNDNTTHTEVDSTDYAPGHGRVRPRASTTAATQRDIHISSQGQHEHPRGPTRIATWRPIPGQSVLVKEFTPTPEQVTLINQLKEYTEGELALKQGDELYESYGKWERRFLQRPDTYSRYMRAADWKMDNARKRIKETLEWRRAYQPDLIKPEEIRVEAEGGKVVVNGFDRVGRPIVWLRPSRENTKPSPTQIRHLIFQLERAIDLLPDGVEKLALVVDYKGATSSNNPSLKTVKEVIYMLQNHYVERLGKGVVVNVPFYLNAFFSVIKPLLDPKTKSKVAFNPSLEKLIPNDQLDSEFKNGDYEYIYDSNVYLTALCHFCGVKEDGTREDVIPVKDLRDVKPEEIQRSLTQQTGDTAEEEAAFARKEAEALERQRREAEEYAKKGCEAPVLDDDVDHAVEDNATATANVVSTGDTNNGSKSTGDGIGGAAAVATAATAAAATVGGAGLAAAHNHSLKTHDNIQMHPKGAAREATTAMAPVPITTTTNETETATATPPEASTTTSPALATTSVADDSTPTLSQQADTTLPSKDSAVPTVAATALPPATTAPPTPPAATPPPAATAVTPTAPTSTGAAAPTAPAAPTSAATTTAPSSAASAKQSKRGGWKLFSSKRGLDKEGKATTHKHKHITKALCMHKGAIDPSWATPTSANGQAALPVAAEKAVPTSAANGTGSTPNASDGRIKIAPEALEGREERTYNNAPLATNATFGPDAYHTAMEAYPNTTGLSESGGGGDYFTDMRKIPPVKPALVDDEHKDQAKMVKRPTEIMDRLHEGGTGDLVLAFEVKQPPIEKGAETLENGESSALPEGTKKAKDTDKAT